MGDSVLNQVARTAKHVGACSEKGLRPENQDVYLVNEFPEIGGEKVNALVVGVLDGHGSSGKPVATLTRDAFQKEYRESESKVLQSMINDKDSLTEHFTASFLRIQKLIEDAAEDKSIKIKPRFSGTTVAISLITETHIAVANCGDSDVVLGGLLNENDINSDDTRPLKMRAERISVCHQLCLEEERDRVIREGGRVEVQKGRNGQDLDGPLRIWLKGVQTPGLMVSRSIGDTVCHEIGVISEPSVVQLEIQPKDTILILASDGLWEFVKPLEAVEFTACILDPQVAADGLTKMALVRQTAKNADNVTVAVVFLEDNETREARLKAIPNWEQLQQERLDQIREYATTLEDQQNEHKQMIQKKLDAATAKDTKESAAPGSILYGDDKDPNALTTSVIAGSALDVDEDEEGKGNGNKAQNAKGSGACVIL